MNTLIIKLNATGDVVRTTPLLRALEGTFTWITDERNLPLVERGCARLTCLSWRQREQALEKSFDLVINLEDELEVSAFAAQIHGGRVFGAYLSGDGKVTYSEESRGWFDLSLISRFGRECADELKFLNRRSYQDLIFEGLGLKFGGEPYVLPTPTRTALEGDVALAAAAGEVWPMKNWAYFTHLRQSLERAGLVVNVLPYRETVLQHLGDIANHRCVVSADSLPMHLAIGLGKPAVAVFNCTSPWEIHDYGLLTKLVSPRLGEYFYKRTFDSAATTAIALEDVFEAVVTALQRTSVAHSG